MFSFLLPTLKKLSSNAIRVCSQPLVTSPGNSMILLVESVRQRHKHCRLFWAKTTRALLGEQITHCLCKDIYCDVPSGRKVKLLVTFERKKDCSFQRFKLCCVSLLQQITVVVCFTPKFVNKGLNYNFNVRDESRAFSVVISPTLALSAEFIVSRDRS